MSPDITEHGPEGGGPEIPGSSEEQKGTGFSRTAVRTRRTRERMTSEEKKLKEQEAIPTKIDDLKRVLEEKISLGTSFDVVFREMVFGGRRCAILYLNGFAKDTVWVEMIKRLTYVKEERLAGGALEAFQNELVAHIQVDRNDNLDEILDKVLAGMSAFFVEYESAALLIDAKQYPVRSLEEPQLEKVVRGSRDGFVETLMTNVTLIRRRIRDPRLTFKIMKVGTRTKSDICIAYIQDIADPNLVQSFQDKIQTVQVDGIPVGEKQLEEAVVSKGWNPYPTVRYSERPDVVAAHLLEGHIILLADTSPSVMILPCTMFHLMQHVEEYRQTPIVGTYLRWVRYAGIFTSLFLLPLWYLFVAHPELKPIGMQWLGPQQNGHLPILVQFLLAEFGLDLMRMAAIHTPQPLVVAMGLISAILIGEIAIKTGIFVNEVIMYLSIATVGMFATPSYELGIANRIMRVLLLLATAFFSVPGFVGFSSLWLLYLTLQRSFNTPYMWPFIPFNAKALFTIALRRPFGSHKRRLSITKPVDNTRQPT